MFRSRFLLAAVVAAVASLLAPAPSEAGYSVKVKVNGTTIATINDGGLGDTNAELNGISANGTYTTGTGSDKIHYDFSGITNSPGTTIGQMTSSSINIYSYSGASTSAAASQNYRVQLEVMSDGFTAPGQSSDLLSVQTILTGLGGFNASTDLGTAGSGKNEFITTVTGAGQTPASVSTNPTSFTVDVNGKWSSGSMTFNRGSDYAITQSIDVLVKTTNTSDNALAFQDKSLVAAPAPAGLIMLAGALPFAGLLRRRLRKSEQATAA